MPSTIRGNDNFDSAYGAALKALVNFDGTGPTIASSINVGSITDNGVGDYTINFTSALSDANFVATEMANWQTNARPGFCRFNSATSGTLSIKTGVHSSDTNTGIASDLTDIMIAVFR